MAAKKDSLVERVQKSYLQLSEASKSLNKASDELGDSIAKLDSALKKLNLGVTSWVEFQGKRSDEYSWHQDIGYRRIGNKWGLAIRTISHDFMNGGPPDEDMWAFNEAPRKLRIEAVAKIPDLLESLINDAAEMTKSVTKHAGEVDVLTNAIKEISQEEGL